jgi:hypothetical protein
LASERSPCLKSSIGVIGDRPVQHGEIADRKAVTIDTPFGKPSADIIIGLASKP